MAGNSLPLPMPRRPAHAHPERRQARRVTGPRRHRSCLPWLPSAPRDRSGPEAPVFTSWELCHVFNPSGNRPGRPFEQPADDRRRHGRRQERLLGEMISQSAASGVRVPGGFATTAHAFREFLKASDLTGKINARLDNLNTDDVRALAEAGAEIRGWVERAVPSRPRGGDPCRVRAPDEGSPRRPSRCARRPPPRICRMPPSPASRNPSERRRHRGRAAQDPKCSRRSTTTAPSAPACTRASRTRDVALSAGIQRMVRSDLGAPA